MTEADAVRHGAARRDHLASWVTPQTVLRGLGLLGVGAGLWTVAGVPGAVGAGAVALLLYVLSGVYAFGAGQFVLAATVPARLTPELALVELGLALVLVGETVTRRGLVTTALGGVALALVAVGVGSVAGGRETDVALLAGGGFVLLSVLLWLSVRRMSVEGNATTARASRDGEH
jgi:hypothetical protein